MMAGSCSQDRIRTCSVFAIKSQSYCYSTLGGDSNQWTPDYLLSFQLSPTLMGSSGSLNYPALEVGTPSSQGRARTYNDATT